MKTQNRLSELDATKLANLRLRWQLLKNEDDAFKQYLFAEYGNPGEHITIAGDNSIIRKPSAPPAPAAPPAKKGKRAAP